MEYTRPPGEVIRRRLSSKGSVSISELANISGASEELVKSIVREFEFEGNAVLYENLRHPYADWIGGF